MLARYMPGSRWQLRQQTRSFGRPPQLARSVPRARTGVFSRNAIASQRPAATAYFPLPSFAPDRRTSDILCLRCFGLRADPGSPGMGPAPCNRRCFRASPQSWLREKRLSPRRTPRRFLLPLSPKRTQVRLKSLLCLVLSGSRQIHSEPTDVLRGKSAVCGLNGHRAYYIISLFKATYKSTIQVSRNFNALITKTFENSDTSD
jgi:hypothetical protein